MRDLTDQVVAITGATAGIGAATAKALVAQGAKVALGARRTGRLDEMVAALQGAAVAVEMDVRDPDGSRRLVAEAVSKFGKIDAIVAKTHAITADIKTLCQMDHLESRGFEIVSFIFAIHLAVAML